MFNKPISIAAATTLLACVPLYFLSTANFQLSLNNLPLLALSLFVTLIIAITWAGTGGNATHIVSLGRESGSVKWFNASKGFGFITRDSGEDVFVHFRNIRGEGHRVLRDGQRVEFEVSEGDKGLQAEDVAAAG